eukprot:TRINITY_DN1044_c0_g1_i27.p1 TRINITY_DN1044_c0_g1~~TRINITY_DN1044_c0_g1_i27.p1  ORF type:complete len:120 (+),score=26.03 TRINITY_DN1044_c0_g1_i27:361-720(+)
MHNIWRQGNEAIAEKLTDIYLNQHLSGNEARNFMEGREFDKKVKTLSDNAKGVNLKFRSSIQSMDEKMKGIASEYENHKKTLSENFQKELQSLQERKAKIDTDFKETIKAISKNPMSFK